MAINKFIRQSKFIKIIKQRLQDKDEAKVHSQHR